MIPLKDRNPTSSYPVVTIMIIMVNILVFGYELAVPGGELKNVVRKWGFVPARFNSVQSIPSIFTSMFLHGGFIHLAGNMLYLWVFGDNVEDELGHIPFLFFYLTAGAVGTFSQYMVFPLSSTPLIGASGAIAGVLGGYFLLYPTARILTAVIIVIFIRLIYLPAWILLGFWFVIQFFNSTAGVGVQAQGGVAWFAHTGGFVAGFIIVFFSKYTSVK